MTWTARASRIHFRMRFFSLRALRSARNRAASGVECRMSDFFRGRAAGSPAGPGALAGVGRPTIREGAVNSAAKEAVHGVL